MGAWAARPARPCSTVARPGGLGRSTCSTVLDRCSTRGPGLLDGARPRSTVARLPGGASGGFGFIVLQVCRCCSEITYFDENLGKQSQSDCLAQKRPVWGALASKSAFTSLPAGNLQKSCIFERSCWDLLLGTPHLVCLQSAMQDWAEGREFEGRGPGGAWREGGRRRRGGDPLREAP